MNDLFSVAAALEARDSGMTKAASRESASEWLTRAREVAFMIVSKGHQVSADDVLLWCPRPADVHPNATGSIFRDPRFKLVGYRTSTKVSAHARRIGIYQLNVDQ